jgi:hypothetical protein
MSVTADDLLDWAYHAHDQDETDKRAIISRAYYAAYHRCQDWHSSLSPNFGSANANAKTHEKLIQQLLNPSLALPKPKRDLSKELGNRLSALKGVRVLADYRLHHQIPPTLHTQACTDADAIFGL